ncbi:MAG: hypothetical protein H6Q86_2019 [candidate division NC10 bacterium]|nr:hypothetical protein [candidate division NC10 bacterium]
MAWGFPYVEWPDVTTNSDSTASMWALAYSTTPSYPCATGPSPSTAMIELTVTAEATGTSYRARMKTLQASAAAPPILLSTRPYAS